MANVSLQGVFPSLSGNYVRLEGVNWVCNDINKNNKKINAHGRIFTVCGECNEIHSNPNYVNQRTYLVVKLKVIYIFRQNILVPLKKYYLDNHWFKWNNTLKDVIANAAQSYFNALSDARNQIKLTPEMNLAIRGQQTEFQELRTTDGRVYEQEKKQEVDLKAKAAEAEQRKFEQEQKEVLVQSITTHNEFRQEVQVQGPCNPKTSGMYRRLLPANWFCGKNPLAIISFSGYKISSCSQHLGIHVNLGYMTSPTAIRVVNGECFLESSNKKLPEQFLDGQWVSCHKLENEELLKAISLQSNFRNIFNNVAFSYSRELRRIYNNSEINPLPYEQDETKKLAEAVLAMQQKINRLLSEIELNRLKQVQSQNDSTNSTTTVSVHQQANRPFNDQVVHAEPKDNDADLNQLLSELDEFHQRETQSLTYNDIILNGTTYTYPENKNNTSNEINLSPLDTAQESTGMFRIGVKQRLIIDT